MFKSVGCSVHQWQFLPVQLIAEITLSISLYFSLIFLVHQDPIRRRIQDSLSQLVRKTRVDMEEPSSLVIPTQQLSSGHQLSNRALQRAARIFDMKL